MDCRRRCRRGERAQRDCITPEDWKNLQQRMDCGTMRQARRFPAMGGSGSPPLPRTYGRHLRVARILPAAQTTQEGVQEAAEQVLDVPLQGRGGKSRCSRSLKKPVLLPGPLPSSWAVGASERARICFQERTALFRGLLLQPPLMIFCSRSTGNPGAYSPEFS